MIRLANRTRPIFRNRTPILFRVMKSVLRLLCPPDKPGRGQHLVTAFEGGLIHVDTGSSIEYHILFRGCHEPQIVDLIRRLVRPGDVCIDVGANVGALTLVFAQAAGPAGRVIAVEPHPVIGKRLLENIALNRLDQVRVVQAALAEKDGEADFFGFAEDAFHQGISSLLPDDEATRKMTVRTLSGPSFVKEARIERCDFLKIDVEGVESVVLAQLAGLIEAHRPVLVCEYRKKHWAKFGHSWEDVRARLLRLDYLLYVVRRNVVLPLGETIPDSCDLLAIPARQAGL
ncbi:MAG: FkbM family methyltransferase [Kiritimatiellia bacterium]